MDLHNRISGLDAIHEIMWIGSTDPASDPDNDVQPFQWWLDTTGAARLDTLPAPAKFKTRNAGNTGWDLRMDLTSFLTPVLVGNAISVIDGGGAAITTGIKGDIGPFDFACEIEKVTLLADQAGSIVIDLWKDSYANYAPTVADTITASAKPTLSSADKSQDATLTGWTKTIAVGDILRINVDSATTVQRVTLTLKLRRTL